MDYGLTSLIFCTREERPLLDNFFTLAQNSNFISLVISSKAAAASTSPTLAAFYISIIDSFSDTFLCVTFRLLDLAGAVYRVGAEFGMVNPCSPY